LVVHNRIPVGILSTGRHGSITALVLLATLSQPKIKASLHTETTLIVIVGSPN